MVHEILPICGSAGDFYEIDDENAMLDAVFYVNNKLIT